ncbi:MAG: hypothetical protein JRJ54_07210 [Deltaproteobacteria bacterium]|nr:hypothetical protein [Deltaproteobacteria bacterium]
MKKILILIAPFLLMLPAAADAKSVAFDLSLDSGSSDFVVNGQSGVTYIPETMKYEGAHSIQFTTLTVLPSYDGTNDEAGVSPWYKQSNINSQAAWDKAQKVYIKKNITLSGNSTYPLFYYPNPGLEFLQLGVDAGTTKFHIVNARAVMSDKDRPTVGYTGSSLRPLAIDKTSYAVKAILFPHAELHEGNHYMIGGFREIGSGVTFAFTVYVPLSEDIQTPHMTFRVSTTTSSRYWVTEENQAGIAVQPGTGTRVYPVNNDRNSGNTSYPIFTYNPNIFTQGANSGASDYLDSNAWGTVGIGNASDIGGSGSHEIELKLKSGVTTIYYFQSDAASNIIGYKGTWYERKDKPK